MTELNSKLQIDILREAIRREAAGDSHVVDDEAFPDLDPKLVWTNIRALQDAGLVEARRPMVSGRTSVIRVTTAGRQRLAELEKPKATRLLDYMIPRLDQAIWAALGAIAGAAAGKLL